ncbi:hypothetical protein [Porphyrobacter sp. CACIAM 03H1]|uniref:hypothetical protein n=1 Tax=Porphyrobacter sp. CACIAM 03H1 TaxID=2003315 RepID=UPI000B5A5B61|nr:hypothetical protein [Porphyrobacter sp. CACIAM 03H1]ASJ92549.1 hypothetical protein CBR61_08155 [Porphyrobacter sp. CACIAM 03H1]
MTISTTIRLRAAALLSGLALALAGCFMSPGKFTSELVLTGPDSFTFSYEGEIFFLGLSKLAQMGAAAEESFTPSECFSDETFEPRECTKEELEAQRAEWDAGAAERAARAKKDAETMKAIMGGIDPSDPKAAEQLVKLLERQKGWNRVVHKGDGLFEVSYAVSGTTGHDFMFPMIESFPPVNPFVQMFLRDGSQARINAPGFAIQNGDNPIGGMAGGMGALAGLAAMGAAEGSDTPAVPSGPVLEGTFTIRTGPGMRILANNTDEGPEAAPGGGEVLRWSISQGTTQAPTALIATAR